MFNIATIYTVCNNFVCIHFKITIDNIQFFVMFEEPSSFLSIIGFRCKAVVKNMFVSGFRPVEIFYDMNRPLEILCKLFF